jgi:dihydroneopterin aldolase
MTILIRDLTFEAIIGILPEERRRPQKVIVDCEIGYHYTPNEKSFIDYAEVAALITSMIQKEKFGLVEEALERLLSHLKVTFPPIETIKITICKPDILPHCTVCVTDFRNFL